MSDCPKGDLGFQLDGDTLAVFLAFLTVLGSTVTYFTTRRREKRDEAAAERRRETEIDREQALARVREQLSVFIGPTHRLYKTFSTIVVQYCQQSGHGMDRAKNAITQKGSTMWGLLLREEFLEPFINDPYSFEAKDYRNFVTRNLKPLYTRIRENVLAHMADLADLPSQEEWLAKHDRASVASPILGSLNVNVIFDTFSVWTFEFDDIIESWVEEDFRRMQPKTVVNWLICNELIDWLYDEAKMKEAKYNKHVKVHKNLVNGDITSQISFMVSNGNTKEGTEGV